MRKLGLDINKVKYVVISHAHGDHDGGARFLQDKMPAAHLVYGGPDWDAVDKSTNHAGGKPKRDMVGTDGMSSRSATPRFRSSRCRGIQPGRSRFCSR